jgi:hypothetical protein
MAASPETDALLLIGDTYSSLSPSSSPALSPTQENSSLTTAAPPEAAHLDHTTPTPLPPPQQDTAECSELGESPQPTDAGGLAPKLPTSEAAPAASPALEAASPEKPSSPPSCAPDASVEVLRDVAASAASPPPSLQASLPPSKAAPAVSRALEAASPEKPSSPPSCALDAPVEVSPDVVVSAASPPPSPQIAQVPPVDAPSTVLPPCAPPATTSPCAALDSSAAEAVATASQEAASPPPASDRVSHSAPAPLAPQLESGSEGLQPQQHTGPTSLEMMPQICENSEPAQPPPPPQAGRKHVSSNAVAGEVASAEAAGSPLALEAMDGERDTASDVPLALECGAEEELPQQHPRSPCSELVAPRCQNSEPAELPQVPPLLSESTYCSLESAVNEVAAEAQEEAAGSPPKLDAMGGEAALESLSDGQLQEPMKTSSSPMMEADPCSPDMAPPGFESFKSKWLPLSAPTLPVESTQYLVEVPATDTVCVMPEAVAGSLAALEAIDMKIGIPPGQLPTSRGSEDGALHRSLKLASSLTTEAAPCSPDTPPPGFENFKQSWLPQPSIPPSAKTTYSPDVATTKEQLVGKACSVPAPDTTDVETDIARNLLPALESGAGDLLQGPEPSSPSRKMQAAPCSPHIMPPGFESSNLPQLQLPSPIAQTSHILQDSVATGAVFLTSEDTPQPSPVLEAKGVEMDAAPALPTTLESGVQESVQQEPSQLPSCTLQGTTCSVEMLFSGSENLESLADAVITTVTVEAVDHPLSITEATKEANGHVLPPPLENGSSRPLPCLEPKASSPVTQIAPSSPEVTCTGPESLESFQQTSPHLAERIDSPSHLPVTESVTVKSEKMTQLLPSSQATDTDMENALALQSPSKSEEKPLPHPEPSSPSGKDAPCSPDIAPPGYENFDSSEELLSPLCPNFGQYFSILLSVYNSLKPVFVCVNLIIM